MLGLAAYRLLPAQAQPTQVLEDRGIEARPAAPGVDVLHANDEATADGARRRLGEKRRVSMAQVEVARGRRRETGDGGGLGAARMVFGYAHGVTIAWLMS